MSGPLLLVSHLLCPYVQRVAIVLAEKGLAFERRDIDLAHKPDWFLKLSPLGKTPLLLDGDAAIFESAVICEYLDETALPRLHPSNALLRAQHRAWMEFGSALLKTIAGFYSAQDEAALAARAAEIRLRLEQLEAQLTEGPYFAGASFNIVDAVFAPILRYFDVFDNIAGAADFGFWTGLPKLQRWRRQLAARPSVVAAAQPDYPQRLQEFLLARQGALAGRMLARQLV
ncbi:glutathione S-transferase family protein [Roseateles oligotrophus]|uniref:glutathione transferase n=1 Tax=Roseateles oligotrophus TaxID=1769250 RepID=A0ABT2YBA1_9BURK|nr:glutathione S-transferase family protein [Roseateles oligotrophus]MCV2367583.1 glutathione S-transferase family protein [Roseateles oligotrophus]